MMKHTDNSQAMEEFENASDEAQQVLLQLAGQDSRYPH